MQEDARGAPDGRLAYDGGIRPPAAWVGAEVRVVRSPALAAAKSLASLATAARDSPPLQCLLPIPLPKGGILKRRAVHKMRSKYGGVRVANGKEGEDVSYDAYLDVRRFATTVERAKNPSKQRTRYLHMGVGKRREDAALLREEANERYRILKNAFAEAYGGVLLWHSGAGDFVGALRDDEELERWCRWFRIVAPSGYCDSAVVTHA